MFYTYDQNNSGGGFDYDDEAGISCYVIVEADSADEADDRARTIGLYFDGYGDCECCGDRWSGAWRGTERPEIWGRSIIEYKPSIKWQGEGIPEIYVHYADGRTVGYCE
jgi:hypothetical protein